jgi:hypothetical protein
MTMPMVYGWVDQWEGFYGHWFRFFWGKLWDFDWVNGIQPRER